MVNPEECPLLLLIFLLPFLALSFLVENWVRLQREICAHLRNGHLNWVCPENALMPCDGKIWLFATMIELIIPLPTCGMMVSSTVLSKEEQQQTKERMREDGCFYDCGDEAAAATPYVDPELISQCWPA